MRELELLAPAANKEVAREAILHGADAIYMGASSHGARKNAANSLEDIREVVEFAHQFHAKVYVTVNTLVYEKELKRVESLVWDLYRAGVDALIVQDMALLRMKLPPIALHSSTQCDTRTPEKASFLEKMGFSQIVLARELSISEIRDISSKVSTPLECFIHGALCVCYSGRCQASEVCLGRSANRGECAQMCRLPYTLRNVDGETLMKDKYLLSLSDFNASAYVGELIEAGASSFKIEGRLKDADYVKNVTAAYRKIIDDYISTHRNLYCRASYGESEYTFTPDLNKSFNRGFTDYFLPGRREVSMASLFTPKSLGERIENVTDLNNGDGISYYNPATGEYEGVRVNRVADGRILTAKRVAIPSGAEIRRTFDTEWQKQMSRETAVRKLSVDVEIDERGVTAVDERGMRVRLALNVDKSVAKKKMEPRPIFEKLGNTIYRLRNFENKLDEATFIPASQLTQLRRDLLSALDKANELTYGYDRRREEDREYPYVYDILDSRENVANSISESFYKSHGVKRIEKAIEVEAVRRNPDTPVMTTRYCLRRELGCCKKHATNRNLSDRMREPLTITTNRHTFRLEFDCAHCEMNLYNE